MVRAVAYFLRTTSSQTSFATTHLPSPPMLLYCANVHSESFKKYDSGIKKELKIKWRKMYLASYWFASAITYEGSG